jgi:hypothetical protein
MNNESLWLIGFKRSEDGFMTIKCHFLMKCSLGQNSAGHTIVNFMINPLP